MALASNSPNFPKSKESRDGDPLLVITGGGQGLGAAIVRKFVNSNWKCIILDNNIKPARNLQDELGKTSVPLIIECDVALTAQVDEVFKSIAMEYKGIDALVNNAGIVRPSPSHEVEDDDWIELVNIHMGGTMRVTRAAIGLLLASHSPTIVNISSVCAALGFPGRLSYNASKAGIESITRTLATEWGECGVRVNAVAPGFILTEASKAIYDSKTADVKVRASRTTLGRLGQPSEVAEAVFWLSCDLSSYVTGQVLVVDGGFLIEGSTGPDSTYRSPESIRSTARIQPHS